mmetsp:Transcript_23369/g.74835  ORF Transcript_23369/g.74835 Transcript_23369/m.74835 type:complete len:249 (+) Transcript_23369:48-794(+)
MHVSLGLLYADHTYEGAVHLAIDELAELRPYAALVHAAVRAVSAEPASLLLRRALPHLALGALGVLDSGRAAVPSKTLPAGVAATAPLLHSSSSSSSDTHEAIISAGFDAALERLRPLLADARRAAAAACEWSERARRSENDSGDQYRLPQEACAGPLTGTRASPRLLLWEAELGQRMVPLLVAARAAAVGHAKAIALRRVASTHRQRHEQLRKRRISLAHESDDAGGDYRVGAEVAPVESGERGPGG